MSSPHAVSRFYKLLPETRSNLNRTWSVKMRRMTLAKSFAYFGATAANSRWSWSARNENQPIVVLALWQDSFKSNNGQLSYEIGKTEARCQLPGSKERRDNLMWALKNCGGLVKVVIVVAKDPKAKRRTIADSFPQKQLTMRIAAFDADSGYFGLLAA